MNATSIECKNFRICPLINGRIEKVFYEDLKEILMSQHFELHKLVIMANDEKCYSCIGKPALVQCLDDIWNLKHTRLKVKQFEVGSQDTLQLISLYRHFDINKLQTVGFRFLNTKTALKLENFWPLIASIKDRRLGLVVKGPIQFTKNNSNVIKKLLSHSSKLRSIQVYYYGTYVDLRTFFEPFTPTEHGRFRYIKFFFPDVKEKERKSKKTKNENWLDILSHRDYMAIILRHFDFFEILRLRNISRDVRNCIDETQSDPLISMYSISQSQWHLEAIVMLQNGSTKTVTYKLDKSVIDACKGTLRYKFAEYFLHFNADYPPFTKNFELHLKHQKSSLKELRLNGVHMVQLENLQDVLKTRLSPLRVEKLRMDDFQNENDFMLVLPLLDPDSLKTIQIGEDYVIGTYEMETEKDDTESVKVRYEDIPIDNICNLEQWKKADEIIIKNFITVRTEIRQMNLKNFSHVNIKIHRLKTHDVLYLKENMMEFRRLQKWKILFENDYVHTLRTFFGRPHRRARNLNRIWFFNYPNTEESLQLRYVVYLILTRVMTRDIV